MNKQHLAASDSLETPQILPPENIKYPIQCYNSLIITNWQHTSPLINFTTLQYLIGSAGFDATLCVVWLIRVLIEVCVGWAICYIRGYTSIDIHLSRAPYTRLSCSVTRELIYTTTCPQCGLRRGSWDRSTTASCYVRSLNLSERKILEDAVSQQK